MERLSTSLLEHLLNAAHRGPLDEPCAHGVAHNSACGDELHMYLALQGNRVAQARFDARACAGATATASLTVQALEGLTLDRARDLDIDALVAEAAAGGCGVHSHARALVARALAEALEQARFCDSAKAPAS